MIRQNAFLVALLGAAVLFFNWGCKDKNDIEPEGSGVFERVEGSDISMEMFESALQKFSLDAFAESVSGSEQGENVCVSPLSLAGAVYMVYNGARGETKTAIEDALRLERGIAPDKLNAAYVTLCEMLESRHAGVSMKMAHGVFWDDGRLFPHDAFLDIMTNAFDAEQASFSFSSDGAEDIINNWVEEKTLGRIDKIVDQLAPEEVMVLLNALYLTADWDEAFPDELTATRDFRLSDGSVSSVEMMFADRAIPHYLGPDYTAVDLMFKDTNYTMTYILPGDGEDIGTLIDDLTPAFMADLHSRLKKNRIILYLPKFEIDHKVQATDMLKRMGMSIAFEPGRADLSNIGIAPEGSLFINRVLHKSYLKVDEYGVEGAAATGVFVGVNSAPPVIRFDEPFVFLVRHKPTGAIIFAGKVENPS